MYKFLGDTFSQVNCNSAPFVCECRNVRYNESKVELQQLLENKSYKNNDMLLPYPNDADVISVATFLASWRTVSGCNVADVSIYFRLCAPTYKSVETRRNEVGYAKAPLDVCSHLLRGPRKLWCQKHVGLKVIQAFLSEIGAYGTLRVLTVKSLWKLISVGSSNFYPRTLIYYMHGLLMSLLLQLNPKMSLLLQEIEGLPATTLGLACT